MVISIETIKIVNKERIATAIATAYLPLNLI